MTEPNGTRSAGASELEIGWKWFEFHATQRLNTFRFFLMIYGATAGIALALLERGYAGFGFLGGILTLFVSFLFWSMDKRNRQLTEIGESIIDAEWKRNGFAADLNPIKRATLDLSRGMRFRIIFRRLFLLGCMSALVIIVWAIFLLQQQYGVYNLFLDFFKRMR